MSHFISPRVCDNIKCLLNNHASNATYIDDLIPSDHAGKSYINAIITYLIIRAEACQGISKVSIALYRLSITL